MTVNKSFYNFEKIEERWQKKFKKIIAHNVLWLGEVGGLYPQKPIRITNVK